jgi:opacity protein-like surface antigen
MIKKVFCFPLILILTSLIVPNSWAGTKKSNYIEKPWKGVLAIGGGAAITSNVGSSKTFPISNPVTDQFFIYDDHRTTQAAGFVEAFLGAERKIHTNWIMQIGLDFTQMNALTSKGDLTQGADTPSADEYSYKYSIKSRQLLAAGKFLYRWQKYYLPYVFLGLGAAWNKAYDYGTSIPPFSTFTRDYSQNTQTSFSYSLGLGLDYEFYKTLRLGIGYRFADLGRASLGSAQIDTTSVSGTLSQSHIYTSEILAQLTVLLI